MKKILLFLFISFFLFSCKRSDPELLEYPSTFYSSHYALTSANRLFTKNGEVLNSQVISNYFGKRNSTFFLSGASPQTVLREKIVLFLSRDYARLHFGTLDTNYVTSSMGNDLVFTSQKVNRFTVSDEYLYDLLLKIGKRKPSYFIRSTVPTIWGFQTVIETKKENYVTLNDGRIEFQMLNICVSTASATSSYEYSYSNVNNEFDETSFTFLRDEDSLGVQQFKLICVR